MSSSKGDVTKRLSFSSKSEVLPSVKRSCSAAKFLPSGKSERMLPDVYFSGDVTKLVFPFRGRCVLDL